LHGTGFSRPQKRDDGLDVARSAICSTSPRPSPQRVEGEERILRKYGYPPDKQEKATQTVLEQAELLGTEQAEATQS